MERVPIQSRVGIPQGIAHPDLDDVPPPHPDLGPDLDGVPPCPDLGLNLDGVPPSRPGNRVTSPPPHHPDLGPDLDRKEISWGTPIQTWDWGTPCLDLGWGTPCPNLRMGYPPVLTWEWEWGGNEVKENKFKLKHQNARSANIANFVQQRKNRNLYSHCHACCDGKSYSDTLQIIGIPLNVSQVRNSLKWCLYLINVDIDYLEGLMGFQILIGVDLSVCKERVFKTCFYEFLIFFSVTNLIFFRVYQH